MLTHFSLINRMIFGYLLFALLFASSFSVEVLSDEQWLKTTSDIDSLTEVALKELKRSSSIHLFDDFKIVKILEHTKSIAGYSQSLLLRLQVSSQHFKSQKEEETVSILVLRHKQNGKYSFAIPDYPVIHDSYINHQEEVWSTKHREERDKHFDDLEQYASSDAFENQDYLI